MKKSILLLAASAILAVALFAADAPVVTIADTGNVYVDGMNVGAPADAIANNPALASPIQTALVAYVATKETEKVSAIEAAQESVADTLAAKDAQIATLTSEKAALAADKATLQATVAARDAQLATSATYIATLQALVTSLGGTVPNP